MNKDRFHNEMAMQLGHERIVNDKRILISVEDSDSLWVILKVKGHDDIRFKASDNADDVEIESITQNKISVVTRPFIIIINKAQFN